MLKILKKSKISLARLGVLTTPHGQIETPFFMPDATSAVIKNLTNEDLYVLDLDSFVVNTYHLYLQPGLDIIKKSKGVHNFMNWSKPILSDSGGYQVFSLIHKNKNNGKILDDKVIFKSLLNGSKHELTPEKSIQIQFILGTDMMVVLDDCPPNSYKESQISQAVDRTIVWAKRCLDEFNKQIKKYRLSNDKQPLLFAVIQGGDNEKLRQLCAKELIKLGFAGYGFGARPVDSSGKFLKNILQFTANLIPENKLRFGLGIGLPEDIVNCVRMGWDMFDCVIPTREGRHGKLFFQKNDFQFSIFDSQKEYLKFYQTININNAIYKKDFSPINSDSQLPLLCQYSRAYLHHLFKIKDPLAGHLASLNNLEFYIKLIKDIRLAILVDKI
ncbi:MAG: tRNA guanosine(34) transglycosylase Tgt [Patescibacteria group bacterium]|nr:tRNA guanosine(34) transglycosylase Tgt [Patescibacteria group bacterium]MBU1870745.1 tRNA guanosine(34) transglycosylase Tgt [Patescibacteria group bacterium]